VQQAFFALSFPPFQLWISETLINFRSVFLIFSAIVCGFSAKKNNQSFLLNLWNVCSFVLALSTSWRLVYLVFFLPSSSCLASCVIYLSSSPQCNLLVVEKEEHNILLLYWDLSAAASHEKQREISPAKFLLHWPWSWMTSTVTKLWKIWQMLFPWHRLHLKVSTLMSSWMTWSIQSCWTQLSSCRWMATWATPVWWVHSLLQRLWKPTLSMKVCLLWWAQCGALLQEKKCSTSNQKNWTINLLMTCSIFPHRRRLDVVILWKFSIQCLEPTATNVILLLWPTLSSKIHCRHILGSTGSVYRPRAKRGRRFCSAQSTTASMKRRPRGRIVPAQAITWFMISCTTFAALAITRIHLPPLQKQLFYPHLFRRPTKPELVTVKRRLLSLPLYRASSDIEPIQLGALVWPDPLDYLKEHHRRLTFLVMPSTRFTIGLWRKVKKKDIIAPLSLDNDRSIGRSLDGPFPHEQQRGGGILGWVSRTLYSFLFFVLVRLSWPKSRLPVRERRKWRPVKGRWRWKGVCLLVASAFGVCVCFLAH